MQCCQEAGYLADVHIYMFSRYNYKNTSCVSKYVPQCAGIIFYSNNLRNRDCNIEIYVYMCVYKYMTYVCIPPCWLRMIWYESVQGTGIVVSCWTHKELACDLRLRDAHVK